MINTICCATNTNGVKDAIDGVNRTHPRVRGEFLHVYIYAAALIKVAFGTSPDDNREPTRHKLTRDLSGERPIEASHRRNIVTQPRIRHSLVRRSSRSERVSANSRHTEPWLLRYHVRFMLFVSQTSRTQVISPIIGLRCSKALSNSPKRFQEIHRSFSIGQIKSRSSGKQSLLDAGPPP